MVKQQAFAGPTAAKVNVSCTPYLNVLFFYFSSLKHVWIAAYVEILASSDV